MRRTITALLGAALIAVVGAPAGAAPAVVTRAPMLWHMQSGNTHGSPVAVGAVAQLVRTEWGISFAIDTEQLIAGHAYTAWIVVVNDPQVCATSTCTPPEILTNTATNSQITYGTGHVVGSSDGNFGGFLPRGPIPEGWLSDQGLDNPIGAEIHLVLNDHGPMLMEFMPGMIQTYRAGCTDVSLPAIFPPTAKADGTPGPNTCQLRQFVVFG